MIGQIRSVQVIIRSGQVRTCQIRAEELHVMSCQIRYMTSQVRSGQNWSGQDRSKPGQSKVRSGRGLVNVRTFQVKLDQIT